jgi:ATP-dependent Lhr-like helicase
LREMRRKPASGALVSLSAADPLNLVGTLTPGLRLPALTGNRLLYRDGLPVATLTAGEIRLLEEMDPPTEWEARKALLRALPSPSISPAPALERLKNTRINGSARAVGRGAS